MSEQGSVNRAIAEALGYTVKPVPSLEDANRIAFYLFCDATGEGVHYQDGGMLSVPITGYNEASAWERGCGDYEHSLDAVVTELRGKPVELVLDFVNGMAALSDFSKPGDPFVYYASSVGKVDAVDAAARALLAWAQAQRGEGA